MIVREQDVLKREPPNGGTWTEDNLRAYQESKGINYGETVYQRGVKPYREWSNKRDFDEVAEVDITPLTASAVQEPTVASLLAEIAALKAKVAINEPDAEKIDFHTGVDRHGLNKPHTMIHPSQLDRRTKEYQDWKKSQESPT